jgi:protein-L-isoaspartate O-methyltransferase
MKGRSYALEKANWEKLIDNLVKQSIIRTPKIAQTMRLTPRSKFLPTDKTSLQ